LPHAFPPLGLHRGQPLDIGSRTPNEGGFAQVAAAAELGGGVNVSNVRLKLSTCGVCPAGKYQQGLAGPGDVCRDCPKGTWHTYV
jgi:hypothetical protein